MCVCVCVYVAAMTTDGEDVIGSVAELQEQLSAKDKTNEVCITSALAHIIQTLYLIMVAMAVYCINLF